jgi:NADH:ubiquinone oxidoreductase subunit 6 (subunit J)
MISRFVLAVVAVVLATALAIFVGVVAKAEGAAGLRELIFIVLIAVTIGGAMVATNAQRLIRSVTGLAICFIGVAGLYYYLNSPFLAVMQMLIYVGAVCVTIVFAVMLADPASVEQRTRQNILAGGFSFAIGLLLFWGLAGLGRKTNWMTAAVKNNDGSVAEVGKSLLTSFSLVFELISVVLLIAIIGSLVLARSGRTPSGRKT